MSFEKRIECVMWLGELGTCVWFSISPEASPERNIKIFPPPRNGKIVGENMYSRRLDLKQKFAKNSLKFNFLLNFYQNISKFPNNLYFLPNELKLYTVFENILKNPLKNASIAIFLRICVKFSAIRGPPQQESYQTDP